MVSLDFLLVKIRKHLIHIFLQRLHLLHAKLVQYIKLAEEKTADDGRPTVDGLITGKEKYFVNCLANAPLTLTISEADFNRCTSFFKRVRKSALAISRQESLIKIYQKVDV